MPLSRLSVRDAGTSEQKIRASNLAEGIVTYQEETLEQEKVALSVKKSAKFRLQVRGLPANGEAAFILLPET